MTVRQSTEPGRPDHVPHPGKCRHAYCVRCGRLRDFRSMRGTDTKLRCDAGGCAEEANRVRDYFVSVYGERCADAPLKISSTHPVSGHRIWRADMGDDGYFYAAVHPVTGAIG